MEDEVSITGETVECLQIRRLNGLISFILNTSNNFIHLKFKDDTKIMYTLFIEPNGLTDIPCGIYLGRELTIEITKTNPK